LPILIVYNASAIGSIYGGYLPESFIRIGFSAQRARLAAMLLCATLVVPFSSSTTCRQTILESGRYRTAQPGCRSAPGLVG